MLGERPVAEYGIALAALGALIFVVRAILNYLTFVHNNPQKGSLLNNGFASFKDRFIVGAKQIDDISKQIDAMFIIWSPDRAKLISETHAFTKETLTMHKVYDSEQRPVWWMPAKLDETLKELLKESKKTNVLLEKFIALQTQEHNIIIKDIREKSNPWNPPKQK